MKRKPSRLPKILQWIFLINGILTIVAIAIFLTITASDSYLNKNKESDRWPVTYGEIGLSMPKGQSLNPTQNVETVGLKAEIRTSDPEIAKAYFQELRPSMITHALILGTLVVIICEFFRRFFKNVSRGETFTKSNIKNLHKIGTLIIVFTLAFGIFGGIGQKRSADFIAENIEMESLVVSPKQPGQQRAGVGLNLGIDDIRVHIDFGGILSGLIIIALGEAFRQGLRIREENDLTV